MNGKSTTNKAGVANKGQPAKKGLLIRDAHSEELNEVSLLIREAYMEYEHSFPAEHWKFYLENIMDVRSRLSDSELIVAELDRKLVGVVTLYLDASSSSQEQWPKGWAGVRLLAVRPAYRGQGIGRALMEECIYRCRKQNIKTIGLHTAIIMSVARKMYEDMGFVRAPDDDFQPRPGTVVMAYRLQL
jgi:GNAT superfamily N-acetyltransferase